MTAGTIWDQDLQEAAIADELRVLEVRTRPEDWKILTLIVVVAVGCAAVVLPYRSVVLPKQILFAAGICSFLLALPLILDDYEKIVFIFLAYMPFSKVVPGTFGRVLRTFNATNLLLIFLVAGWALHHSLRHRPLYRRGPLDLVLGGFLFLAVFSLLRGFMMTEGRAPVDVIFAMKRWITPMFFYFIVVNALPSVRQCRLAALCVVLTTALIGGLGLKEAYMDVGPRSSMAKMRISVTSGPNHLGFLMCSCVFLLIALWYVYRHRSRWYWLLWIPILSCIQTMRLTFSRGAQVGLVAGLWYFLFLVNKKAWALFTLLLVVVAVEPAVLPAGITGRLSHTVVRSQGDFTDRLDKSSAQRLVIWKAGMEMVADYPFFGVGYHNFPRMLQHYNPSAGRRDAHNTYMIVAAEMGLPALFFLLYFLYRAWRIGLNVLRHSGRDPILRMASLGFLSLMAATVVSNVFGTRFDSNEVSVQFYAMVGVVCNLDYIVQSRLALGHEGPPPSVGTGGQPSASPASSEADRGLP